MVCHELHWPLAVMLSDMLGLHDHADQACQSRPQQNANDSSIQTSRYDKEMEECIRYVLQSFQGMQHQVGFAAICHLAIPV